MPDIFISYSRKDSEQAQLLTELLASAGLSVWIDQSGIGAAMSWSGEISKAITDCKALIVLLSPSSVDSKNVTREVALAFERNKKILPIDIEPVMLPDDFAYHLAGLQRSTMTNIDAIIRALSKLGLEATGAPQAPKIVKEQSDKKSLMILPFEDLSPTQDNQWFTDGMASELIGSLSAVKSLRLIDWNTAKLFRDKKVKTIDLARELDARYFLEGQVRKFGDQIKISVTLLDIETGDHIWQDALRGTMENVFDIQEEVAKKVVDALKIHLASDQEQQLAKRGTANVEAYELYLKAAEYASRNTREGQLLALQQLEQAIALDPGYASAIRLKASGLIVLYRLYDRRSEYLSQAEALARHALELRPDLWEAYHTLSLVYFHQGKLAEAEEVAKEFVRQDPSWFSYAGLGLLYGVSNRIPEAIEQYEKAIELKPDAQGMYFNLTIACNRVGDRESARKWVLAGLPFFEKRLRLVPDDISSRTKYATLLSQAGQVDRALQELRPLLARPDADSNLLYDAVCLFCRVGDVESAMSTFRRAVESGFADIDVVRADSDIDPLRALPEFQNLVREMEAAINA